MIREKIIHGKKAYFLIDLLRDTNQLCGDYQLSRTSQLRKILSEEFEDEVSFFPYGKNCLVHASDINPCEYPLAIIKGKGLKDDDIIKAFGEMIHRKVRARKDNSDKKFPYTPEELSAMIENDGPIPELYNAIFATIRPFTKTNEHGYAETSSQRLATKIWATAYDWENLLTNKNNVKQIITGSLVHRLTGRKDVVKLLNQTNNSITYDDLLEQNMFWFQMVTQQGVCPSLATGISTHVTLDNNDGCQDTTTGKGTTHDTNFTVFQPVLKGEMITPVKMNNKQKDNLVFEADIDESSEIPEFSIGQKKTPPLMKTFVDNKNTSELEKSLKKDLVWAITIGVGDNANDDHLIGSWTDFKKKTSIETHKKSLLEYLPAVAQPPEYPVCKKFLDDCLEMMNDLEINHIFAHGDEQVYARLCHILWKDRELYQNIIVLMGGFHQLRVRQKTIYKRHAVKGLQQWCTDSGTVATGSSDAAIEGRHYYRCMRIHKEMFCALVQYRAETEMGKSYENMDAGLKNLFLRLKATPSKNLMNSILIHPRFEDLYTKLMSTNGGTEVRMTVSYLKDVSSMLALVAAVRDNNLELHLQAEREMLKHVFAFDHVHYARYMGFQQVCMYVYSFLMSAIQ